MPNEEGKIRIITIVIDADDQKELEKLYKKLSDFCDATQYKPGFQKMWIKDIGP